jgi:glycosyltransferase involved in cell wall biosynthesis
MGKPVVSTTIGAEGLPLVAGQDLLLADDPQSFAAALVTVLTNDEKAAELGRQGCATVREKFGWGPVAERFSEICRDAAAGSRRDARSAVTPGSRRGYWLFGAE